jgi:hypothetical protein
VREVMMRFGSGGGYLFLANLYGTEGDPALEDRRRWLAEAYEAYRVDAVK